MNTSGATQENPKFLALHKIQAQITSCFLNPTPHLAAIPPSTPNLFPEYCKALYHITLLYLLVPRPQMLFYPSCLPYPTNPFQHLHSIPQQSKLFSLPNLHPGFGSCFHYRYSTFIYGESLQPDCDLYESGLHLIHPCISVDNNKVET